MEITNLIKTAEQNAINLINNNITKLHDLANALLDTDTLDSHLFNDIMKNGYSPNPNNELNIPNKDTKTRRRSNSKSTN